MQTKKIMGRFQAVVVAALLLGTVGCQQPAPVDAVEDAPSAEVGSNTAQDVVTADASPPNAVDDGFDGGVPTEQASDQRFTGVSSDVADLLERMESCYSLAADARSAETSGAMSADEAGDLQSQLGCDEIESDISRTLQQHADQPKVAQLIQQMKATQR